MNTTTALQIAAKAAELTELSTTFQAKYGKRYHFAPDSPAEATDLYQAICSKQAEIAALLDPMALDNPMKRASEWWRWQQVMDIATAGELAREANHLIASCAYCEASVNEDSPAVLVAQQAIAGMLHPEVRSRVPLMQDTLATL